MRKRLVLLTTSLLLVGSLMVVPHAVADTTDGGADILGSGTQSGFQWSQSSNVTVAQAAAPLSVEFCTGYGSNLASVSSAGHTLSTRANVCGAWLDQVGTTGRWAPVVRFKCYRDGVVFGSGTGGCRWKGSVSSYRQLSNGFWDHQHSTAYQIPPSTNGDYWSDSGRIYGQAFNYSEGTQVKFCEDDWIWDVLEPPSPIGNGVVHFKGTTGIDYGTFNTLDKCTQFTIGD